MKLTIELVPKTAWYSNVRSNVSKTEWDIIRKKCYKLADNKCEICGSKGTQHNVECHEIWDYKNNKQILTGFIALCPNCHKVKHVGLAQINGEEEIVIKQLMKINNLNRIEAIEYIEEAFEIWRKRSNQKWELDISYIEKYKKE